MAWATSEAPLPLLRGQPRANNYSRFESRVKASGTSTDAASHFSAGSFGLLPGGRCHISPFQRRSVTETPHLLNSPSAPQRCWVPALSTEATNSPDKRQTSGQVRAGQPEALPWVRALPTGQQGHSSDLQLRPSRGFQEAREQLSCPL